MTEEDVKTERMRVRRTRQKTYNNYKKGNGRWGKIQEEIELPLVVWPVENRRQKQHKYFEQMLILQYVGKKSVAEK